MTSLKEGDKVRMNAKKLKILEKCFAIEVDCALTKRFNIYQSKSKLAKELADDGYLELISVDLPLGFGGKATVKGYVLTHVGRYTYCSTCT